MNRLSAATLVLLAFVACSFGADLWLDADTAKSWGESCTWAFVVWCLALVFAGDDGA